MRKYWVKTKKLECSFNFMPFVTDVASAVSRCDIKKIAVHLIRKTTICISFGVYKSIKGHKAIFLQKFGCNYKEVVSLSH